MGWTLKNETRVPLKAPITSPATQHMKKPAKMVQMVTSPALKTYWTKMAELIAPSPMLMSCPRAAAWPGSSIDRITNPRRRRGFRDVPKRPVDHGDFEVVGALDQVSASTTRTETGRKRWDKIELSFNLRILPLPVRSSA